MPGAPLAGLHRLSASRLRAPRRLTNATENVADLDRSPLTSARGMNAPRRQRPGNAAHAPDARRPDAFDDRGDVGCEPVRLRLYRSRPQNARLRELRAAENRAGRLLLREGF